MSAKSIILLLALANVSVVSATDCDTYRAWQVRPAENIYSLEESEKNAKARLSQYPEVPLSVAPGATAPLVRTGAPYDVLRDVLNVLVGVLPEHARHRTYTLHVVPWHEINAAVVGGGHIVVTSAAVEHATSVDFLANLLAHELVHAALRHHAQQETLFAVHKDVYDTTKRLVRTSQWKLSPEQEREVLVQKNKEAKQELTALSRRCELEADVLGAWLVRRAGFSVVPIAHYHAQSAAQGFDPGPRHPKHQERIEVAQCFVTGPVFRFPNLEKKLRVAQLSLQKLAYRH